MATQDVQRPAVAGLFYSGDPQRLQAQVEAYLASARRSDAAAGAPAPRALIAPHAGYDFSGPVAGSAYAAIAERAGNMRRVVLIGPAHRFPVRGLAASGAGRFASPLGQVAVDRAAVKALVAEVDSVSTLDSAFTGEHSLEVQLPFLQVLLEDFTLVPLLVGAGGAEAVAGVIERFWDDPQTLIVISSDLSHYLDYATARSLDRRTSEAICALQPEAIAPEQACGQPAIAGLLQVAKAHGAEGRVLDLRSSGDTAGPKDRVVGYGAYAFA
jgi:AmmeMemoRadiSam system protein B